MVLPQAAAALDWVMDKSLVLGYSRIGPALRRTWWPHDPATDALVGRQVLVTGASGGLGLATARGLARLGADLHLTGRDASRLHPAPGPPLGREAPPGRCCPTTGPWGGCPPPARTSAPSGPPQISPVSSRPRCPACTRWSTTP